MCSATYQGSSNSLPLDRVLSDFTMNDATIADAVAHLLVSNQLSGGIALNANCNMQPMLDDTKQSFNLSGLTVKQALDEIVGRDKRYHWQQQNHSIVLSPVSGMPELLKTRVERFEVDNPRYTLSAASGELLQLPEVKSRKKQLDLKEGLQYIIGGADRRDILKGKVSVADVSMYEALNAIAQTNGGAVWRYSEYNCGKVNEFSITWIR